MSYAATAVRDLDIPRLVAMIDHAWRTDYPGAVRPIFDSAYMRWLMPDDESIAVIISDADSLVGFYVALQRTLYCRQRTITAYYGTALTVAPQYRGLGLGRWITQTMNGLVIDQRRGEVIIANYNIAHGGLATVESALRGNLDWCVHPFHTAVTWSRDLASEPLPEPARLLKVEQVTVARDGRLSASCEGSHGARLSLRSAVDANEELRTTYDVAFGLDSSLRTQFFDAPTGDAGTVVFIFDDGVCGISFNIAELGLNERTFGRVGRLQAIHAVACSAEDVRSAVLHVCRWFQRKGCREVRIVDEGIVPPPVLEDLGFHSADDRLTFAVRGPKDAVQLFEAVKPPYYIDMI